MKLTAILAATVLVAGGGAYGLYTYTDMFVEKPADLSTAPVAKTGGCSHCCMGLSAGDAGTCPISTSAGGEGSAGLAAAGPVALFAAPHAAEK
jgi:hypothetical protein